MVDYSSYLVDPNRYQQQSMNNLMNAMAFRENKRKNDLTMALAEKQQKYADQEEGRSQAKFDMDRAIKQAGQIVEVMSAKTPQQAAVLAGAYGIKNFRWEGDNVTFTTQDGTFSGASAHVMESSRRMAQGDLKGAAQYAMDTGVIIQPPAPPTSLEGMLVQRLQQGDMQGAESTAGLMGHLKSVGRDDRTPQMKNAEALINPNTPPELRKALAGLLEKKNIETNVNVDVGPKSMEKMGEEMSKALVDERKDVVGAVASLENLKSARSLLDSGMITGTGAEFLVGMGNLLSSRFGITLAEDPVANTQAFAATMGTQVGQIIKQFGSGTGLSDADREYAEKIVAGKITLNEKAIRRLFDINEKAYKNLINSFNKKAEQAMKKPGAESLPYDLRVEYKDTNAKKETEPPVKDAKQAPDGKWYIQKGGKYFMVVD